MGTKWPSVPERLVLLVNTAPDTEPPSESSSRKWKSPNIRDTSHPSADQLLSREPLSESGSALEPTKRWLVALGSPIPRTTRWLIWVRENHLLQHSREFDAGQGSAILVLELPSDGEFGAGVQCGDGQGDFVCVLGSSGQRTGRFDFASFTGLSSGNAEGHWDSE